MSQPMLKLPPAPFAAQGLNPITINAQDLVRVSRYSKGEPYFGHNLANRFDDPRKPPYMPFRVCYTATELRTAFAETVLHDEEPNNGCFNIAHSLIDSRFVVEFAPHDLVIADLTGPSLKTLGGNGALSTILPYDIPQAWSVAVYEHKDQVDGFKYKSRHLDTEIAVVLFDRAREKLNVARYIPLLKHQDSTDVLNVLNVKLF